MICTDLVSARQESQERERVMKSVWMVLLVLAATTAHSAEIASVAFGRIEPILKEYVLAKPQYSELKKSNEEAGVFDPTASMKTDDKGNIILGKDHMKQAKRMTSRFRVDRLVNDAMRRELVLIIESMGMKHKVVVNGDEEDALLYSKTEIEDITQKVYQELVRRLSEGKPNKNLNRTP